MTDRTDPTDHPEEGLNEYGVIVSVHRCHACGSTFTVCPPAGADWGGCQAEDCESYDPDRDVDLFFDGAYEAGIIRRQAL